MPRVAIVTGGSGALGQAVVLRLLKDGLSVSVPWIVDKERERLESRVPGDARSRVLIERCDVLVPAAFGALVTRTEQTLGSVADRKSTRLNSSHSQISYAVFCLKKKKTN